MTVIENLGNVLIISIIVIVLTLIILVIIERKFYLKLIRSIYSRNNFYMKKIANLNKIGSKNILVSIDQIARNFFIEAFGTKNTEDYSKLENFFKQKNQVEPARFCELMNHALYSGKEINQEDRERLILILIEIVKNNLIATKD